MIRLEKVTRTVASGTEQLTILDAVDLFVPAGQFIAVTGPSGSGKSTLLSLVAGLDAPTSGEVYLAQQRITRMPEDALASLRGELVGIVFQSFHLIPSFTAYENVLVPMELADQKDPAPHARALIEAVGHPWINLTGAGATAVVVVIVGVAATWEIIARKPLGILREQ